MIFDSHAHLNDGCFEDRDQIIGELAENGVAYVLNPGADIKTSQEAYGLSLEYDNIYCGLGTHPHDAKDFKEEDLIAYRDLSKHEKVVAIGEIGLDFYYDNSPKDIQNKVFRMQMDLAANVGLPVLIHSRQATQETYDCLKEYDGKVRGVIHCYSDNWENAKKFLDLGYYIGIGGMVTFKNASEVREVAEKLPIDSLLLETDAPYLSPVPHRGKRNEPKFIKYVAEKIANLRNEDLNFIIYKTHANTLEMLGL